MPLSCRTLVLLLVAASARADDPWSFRPVVKPAVPAQSNAWVRTPVDAFVLAKLTANELHPSPEADRRVLARRVFLDLTGLPPTPDELDTFLRDDSADAYGKLVDRLLASPRYGERWARHWLDVAHYADSHGQDQDRPRPNAWPYRDYVIRSLNADKSYARFVQEQVAGDVLFPTDAQALIATGFLAAGPWDESGLRDINENSADRLVARYLDRDDIVTSTMTAFAGLTVHCARCHDHKFDPITQDDYYALQAVFAGTDKAERSYDADPAAAAKRAALDAEVRRYRAFTGGPALFAVPARWWWKRTLDRESARLPPASKVYCGTNRFAADGSFRPATTPRPVHVLKRGETTRPGKLAVPGAVEAVPGLTARFDLPDEGDRRAKLAGWLTDPKNPLTWRVIVNRVWHYHFGRGIVDTPSDFGKMGGPPSHPELLDWLAADFRDGGGSLKKLHRLIVTSSVYRQAVRHDPAAAAVDADNRLLWRMNRGRLDGEAVRDAVLLASGRLDSSMYGPPVKHFLMTPGVHVTPQADYDRYDVDAPEARRRGVYRYVFRTRPDPLLDALDCPDGSQAAPVRTMSVGAPQALVLWNNKFTLRHAEHLAALAGTGSDPIAVVSQRVLCRPPTPAEATAWAGYATAHGLANLCRVLLNSSEFLFID